jgi:hypothetical protein
MMDERQIREEAWQEGRNAGYRQQAMGDLADRPLNPYAPAVDYTPSQQEITDTLLGTFTWDEIGRYLHQRELNIAALERVRVVGWLERERSHYNRLAGVNHGPLSIARNDTILECVAIIKRLTG